MMVRRLLPPSLIALCVLLAGCQSTPPKSASGGKDGGASRIAIKHATDADAASIDTTPKDITVEDLIATKLPDDFKGGLEDYGDRRVGPFEKSTFRISGTLKSVVHRKDGDYYLVMEGKTGATAVIEVPDPALAKGSPILPQIQAARNEIESKYHPTDTPKDINEPATIEGVGFYGWKGHPGSGGHGSAPRLMPGTGFKSGK
ncbi:MAG TPA: hypothetical protein VHE55_18520 [Fimbriimonadaceae bacterium]|nr:hypothetical protein [Fimbriimonadaceae bacterium]